MADPTADSVNPPLFPTGDFDSDLRISPIDSTFFSDDLMIGGGADIRNGDVSAIEDLDFDFYFDDLFLPSSDDLDELLKPGPLQRHDPRSGSDPNRAHFGPSLDQLHSVFKSTYQEFRNLSGGGELPVDRSWEGSGVLSSSSPEMESEQVSDYLNMPSPESNGSNRDIAENCGGGAAKVSNCASPESQGSGDFESNVSEDSNNCATRTVSSSPGLSKCSIRTGVIVDEKIKLEEQDNKNDNSSFLKRKKEGDELVDNDDNVESRTNKYRKSNCSEEDNNISSSNDNNVESIEEEEKRKARLVRNRESAQLSRQRKKHYVEELEDKVRNMHSTIQDLSAKISFFMAENVTLRQQMSCAGGAAAGSAVPPPPMASPPPGMYTHPAMMYPWMPCPPPYMVKPQGSQVPLVPIPRLKTQRSSQLSKTNKKGERKKNEAPKTKKVASVSFLGLLFFIMLFGGLVPIVNVRYGGMKEAFMGGEIYNVGAGFAEKHHGRVLMVNGTEHGEKKGGGFRDSSTNSSGNEFFQSGNGSEPLAASLYVPRNDKLVKIDGNLIIHSVLATDKAMACRGKGGGETGLVVPGDLAPSIPVPAVGRNGDIHSPHLRSLGSNSGDKDSLKSTTTDVGLQQWFREGLAGPMLSTGLCTEVFQFDISAPGAVIPATTTRNITDEQKQNPKSGRNRRILHPVPLPEPALNISTDPYSEEDNLNRSKKVSSMVVSVLFDPREVGDADVDGVMGTKSLSRIFVVVLIDSVKYVTYSCMLPFTGSVPHLVTA